MGPAGKPRWPCSTPGRRRRSSTTTVTLLDSGLCDAVVVAAPNFTHAELADLLPAPLHLLLEKPLVTRCEDGLAAGPGARPHRI
jgi:predicted dehydrogenase